MSLIVPFLVFFLPPFFFLHLQDIMNSEKSYDSLPNFTAADCEFFLVFSPNAIEMTIEVLCTPPLWLSLCLWSPSATVFVFKGLSVYEMGK